MPVDYREGMKAILLGLFLLASPASFAAARNCATLLQPLPLYAQKADFTCGAVCVRSLMEYLTGMKFSEEQLASALGTYQLGYTHPDAMVRFFNSWGFAAKFDFDKELESLRAFMRAGESLIVSITLEGTPHYAAVKSISPTHVTLMDPWIAREGREQVLTLEEFDKMWTIDFEHATYRGSVLRISRRPL